MGQFACKEVWVIFVLGKFHTIYLVTLHFPGIVIRYQAKGVCLQAEQEAARARSPCSQAGHRHDLS